MAPREALFDDPSLTFSKLCAVWLLTLDPRMQIKGFAKSLCAAIRRDSEGEASDLKVLIKKNQIIPDAYVVDKDKSALYLFEIEDTNPISAAKLRKLSEIWFRLDSIDWEMRVFLIDRYMTCWRSLPLADVWYALKWPDPSKSDVERRLQQRDAEFDWEATPRLASRHAINRPVVKRKRSAADA
jgi:hypothetical protein